MISELVKWLGKRDDRRAFDRKTERFPLAFTENGVQVQGLGTDISATGLSFVTKTKPSTQALNMILLVRGRRISVRIAVRRIDAAQRNDGTVYLVAGQFTGVAADDWDAIVRFVNGAPDPDNVAQRELKKKSEEADDAYRLLPLQVQQEIVRQLVRARRLAPPVEGQHPLLRMRYTGNRARADGTTQHRLVVHSRVRAADQTMAYDTNFVLEENGTVAIEEEKQR